MKRVSKGGRRRQSYNYSIPSSINSPGAKNKILPLNVLLYIPLLFWRYGEKKRSFLRSPRIFWKPVSLGKKKPFLYNEKKKKLYSGKRGITSRKVNAHIFIVEDCQPDHVNLESEIFYFSLSNLITMLKSDSFVFPKTLKCN